MNQQELFRPVSLDKLSLLSKEELITFYRAEQDLRIQLQKYCEKLQAQNEETRQKSLQIEEHYITIKNKLFGRSSEKEPSQEDRKKANRRKKGGKRVLLPSLRYPNAPLIEREIEIQDLPDCGCCGSKMEDSGMTENSEFVTVVPAQFIVVRQKRHKYRCGKCHGDVKTAPAPPKIKPGSAYSDEMMIDVTLSKYCDLIPVDRYAAIAGRAGLKDLPPNSLIEQTHHVAKFVSGVFDLLRKEVLCPIVLHADETPHRMLEGDKRHGWYLWGFSTTKSSYFECHDTRSGDVCSKLLNDSNTQFLVSDVFSGYGKAVRETNKIRAERNLPLILNVYCNAHARRKFKEARPKDSDENPAQFYVDGYKKIYRLERIAKARPPDKPERKLKVRKMMNSFFEAMKSKALKEIADYSAKSAMGKALSYFLKNYSELTLFVENAELPIDNNSQEAQLRNPVVGRKTWYGTHSKRGARTMAILFSLVESCKLNKINPREYFRCLTQDLHQGKPPYTPYQFKSRLNKDKLSASAGPAN